MIRTNTPRALFLGAGALAFILGGLLIGGQAPAGPPDSPGASQDPPAEAAQEGTTPAGGATEAEAPAPAPAPGPMDLFIAFSRTQLALQGFQRHETQILEEPFVWWEKGEGPTLVLIHGVADQAGTWFRVAPGLAESHRVVLVDLPGHGESAPASGPLALTAVLEGFEAWLADHGRKEGEAPPVLLGNSMGAWIALLVGHRHPRWVARVVAVNGGGLQADTGELDLLPESREEARRLMAALRDASSPPTPDAVLDDLVRRVPGGQVSRMFEAREDLESYLLDSKLGEVFTPVDLLWGRSDRYLGTEYPRRLQAGLLRARLTYVESCGHLPQAECPETFTAKLREVLAAEPPAMQQKGETP